ncbi:hypothetical protein EGW08_022484 [Elysia chlorotica]|uniref:Uncharacterized protein n=1 Tax=Elysia chlorotica TaxID=188477 RepID=A0A433SKV4_ELYCH|nr:hypothetical protein EGW08_022484 [Elysia chlorotica]
MALQPHSTTPHPHPPRPAYHMSRAVSDHVTDVARKHPAPPRRFSDSESCREHDGPSNEARIIAFRRAQALQEMILLGARDTGLSPTRNSDPYVGGTHCEVVPEIPATPSPPPGVSSNLARRLSDTALYSSQISDFDEMTSSTEEAGALLTPPPGFADEPDISTWDSTKMTLTITTAACATGTCTTSTCTTCSPTGTRPPVEAASPSRSPAWPTPQDQGGTRECMEPLEYLVSTTTERPG